MKIDENPYNTKLQNLMEIFGQGKLTPVEQLTFIIYKISRKYSSSYLTQKNVAKLDFDAAFNLVFDQKHSVFENTHL